MGLDSVEHIRQICGPDEMWWTCVPRVDSVLLVQDTTSVWRTAEGLNFSAGDKSIMLRDNRCGDCEAFLKHYYLGLLPEIGAHVVEAGQSEGFFFILLSRSTGDTVQLTGFPVLSPDGKHFATASCDIEGGRNPNELQIWSSQRFPPTLEWSMRPNRDLRHPEPRVKSWGPIRPRWRNETTLSVMAYAYKDVDTLDYHDRKRKHDYGEAPGELLFQLVNGKWLFRGYDP